MPLEFFEGFFNHLDFSKIVTGTAQPKLTQKALKSIEVLIPPLNEQRRIVAKIEELTARSQRAREALEAVPPLLDKLRQSVLAAAFSGRLTADWRKKNPLLAPRPGKFIVYVIECDDGSRYIGQTDDLPRRWKEHKEGKGSQWTKAHRPVHIAHWEEYASRHEAVEREKWLKTGFGRKWIKREIAAGRARQARDVEPASKLLERIRTERRQRWEEAELAKLRAKGKEPKDDRWKAKYKEPDPLDPTGLPELPEGWCWISLDEVSWDAQYGTSEKCDYKAQGNPVLRIPNVAGNRLWLENLKRSINELNIKAGGELRPGDFLIVRTNGSRDLIGRAAAILEPLSEPSFFASYLIRYRIVGIPGLNQWISLIWQCGAIRKDLERLAATSAGQYNVSLSKLSKIAVPLPPAGEFLELISRCSTTLESIASESSRAEALLENLERTNESILAKAFRGRLVPQDPNDEPASVLLERIRAHRAAAEAEKKKTKSSRPSRLRGKQKTRKGAKSAKNDDSLQTVLHFLQANPGPHSKIEILKATNLDPTTWPTLAPQLTNHPQIHRTGQKRGSRYEWQEGNSE
jgi:type I restriction enzyme S subunit